jgi:hypothetical protein
MYDADISIAEGHGGQEVEPRSAEGCSSTHNKRHVTGSWIMHIFTVNGNDVIQSFLSQCLILISIYYSIIGVLNTQLSHIMWFKNNM